MRMGEGHGVNKLTEIPWQSAVLKEDHIQTRTNPIHARGGSFQKNRQPAYTSVLERNH